MSICIQSANIFNTFTRAQTFRANAGWETSVQSLAKTLKLFVVNELCKAYKVHGVRECE